MAGSLQQINLKFDAAQDRLLLRMRVGEEEVRLWLTRRYVRLMWGALVKLLGQTPEVAAQPEPKARRAVMAFQHQAAVQQSDFKKKYEAAAPQPELGPAPLLVTGSKLRMTEAKRPQIVFETDGGKAVTVNLGMDTLHSFCRLVQRSAATAEWDLSLDVEGKENAEAPADASPSRVH
ncbi:MAG: hypothetical protein HOH66_07025 [Rhodospirillaceae bacterium]|jgi:hypothetical protein|nr:hypothetical protein [Rhodospirillaceae bacterium]MBT6117603.1 hypothetical protein [Rhodospirillaceae bacterium]